MLLRVKVAFILKSAVKYTFQNCDATAKPLIKLTPILIANLLKKSLKIYL